MSNKRVPDAICSKRRISQKAKSIYLLCWVQPPAWTWQERELWWRWGEEVGGQLLQQLLLDWQRVPWLAAQAVLAGLAGRWLGVQQQGVPAD